MMQMNRHDQTMIVSSSHRTMTHYIGRSVLNDGEKKIHVRGGVGSTQQQNLSLIEGGKQMIGLDATITSS